ncbi:MAG: S9 family peptidase [Acidobacteria bacterium]|nr:S9 family peptidase [Acidobacteriota bacterium]
MLRIVVASVLASFTSFTATQPTVPASLPQTTAVAGQPQGQGAGRGQGAAGRQGGRGPQTPEQIKARRDTEVQRQIVTDATWAKAAEDVMTMEKTTYKSRVGGMTIPVFVFAPLQPRGDKGHPAIVWVHPDIRGHVYEYYIPYVQEAVRRGYVVIAPEYRGSVGYGAEHYDAIDYGGAEVDDVLTAVDYLKTMPMVDPERIGIIGWSHGGMITLLSAARETTTFKAAVAMVPVTNLFQRLAWKGVERQHMAIDPANRYGGLPNEQQDVYKERSPLYQVDKLQIPVLVHVARNDRDVNFEEAEQIVDALRSRKAALAETKIYDAPQGGHLFDRQYARVGQPTDLDYYTPTNTPEQRDSWNRVWTFLDWNLRPYQGSAR